MNLSRPARIGALCWMLAAPLFLAANVIVGLRWTRPPFSWAEHNISDLGNVGCGIWDTTRPRYVCSPWHDGMNVSVLVTAMLLAAGTVLTWHVAGSGRRARAAQSLLLLGAVGYALAAAYPADVDENAHVLGALLIMGMGNLGLLLAALAPRATTLGRLRALTLPMALLALAGTTLFFTQHGLGLGVGGMERVAVFPLPVWACCVGVIAQRLPAPHHSRSAAEESTRR
ncbi:DUF998 domain-containing protein [Plantactinospora sp. S1510]|uniref:DUF998 domain-containing protein n=1 Tax=Plantactinospora alkalitolerans TaxID=2789879 RepID=A0ABS0GN99_9ACTN|nr:DUF998 domain-containing protein [Plantactinospora alkalitolerans]MBF9127657.1 DUF998 domain-containing protein [Plantactinospora alkalitolerans]